MKTALTCWLNTDELFDFRNYSGFVFQFFIPYYKSLISKGSKIFSSFFFLFGFMPSFAKQFYQIFVVWINKIWKLTSNYKATVSDILEWKPRLLHHGCKSNLCFVRAHSTQLAHFLNMRWIAPCTFQSPTNFLSGFFRYRVSYKFFSALLFKLRRFFFPVYFYIRSAPTHFRHNCTGFWRSSMTPHWICRSKTGFSKWIFQGMFSSPLLKFFSFLWSMDFLIASSCEFGRATLQSSRDLRSCFSGCHWISRGGLSTARIGTVLLFLPGNFIFFFAEQTNSFHGGIITWIS